MANGIGAKFTPMGEWMGGPMSHVIDGLGSQVIVFRLQCCLSLPRTSKP